MPEFPSNFWFRHKDGFSAKTQDLYQCGLPLNVRPVTVPSLSIQVGLVYGLRTQHAHATTMAETSMAMTASSAAIASHSDAVARKWDTPLYSNQI